MSALPTLGIFPQKVHSRGFQNPLGIWGKLGDFVFFVRFPNFHLAILYGGKKFQIMLNIYHKSGENFGFFHENWGFFFFQLSGENFGFFHENWGFFFFQGWSA